MRKKINSRTVGTTVSDQPTNPPAMVPWYSTIIAHTAFQLFLGSNLNFLSFDFRGVEREQGPKIFRVHSERTHVLPQPPPAKTAARGTSPAAAGGQASSPLRLKEREKYFYFDWTADVGDGFNSTYEIARLLSQPEVEVPRQEAKRMSARKRLLLRSLVWLTGQQFIAR